MIRGEEEIEVKKALAECNNIQSMIDLSAKRLEGLRTQCLTSAELIQHEIRTLEGKLIKLFSRYLVAKMHIPDQCIPETLKLCPSLKQWLEVVGLSKDSVNGLFSKMCTLEYLLDRTDSEVRTILKEYKARDEEVRRLINALHNLKKYTEFQLADEKGNQATIDIELSWDSWDNTGDNNFNLVSMQTSPKPRRSRATSSSEDTTYKSGSPSPKLCEDNVFKICPSPVSKVPPVSLHSNLPLPGLIGNDCKFTPPPTPPAGKLGKGEKVKFPTTPPPKKKHQAQNPAVLEAFPLTKSKSHESQLAHKVDSEGSLISQLMNFVNMNPNWLNFSLEQLPRPRRGRLATEPGLESGISPLSANTSPLTASPARSPPYYNEDETFYKKTLQVPRSPHSPKYPNVSMSHFIQHRFAKLIKVTTCDYCERQMFIGLKCKECKFKCHRDCESHVPPSCGLPGGLFDAFKSLHENSPVLPRGSPLHVTHLSNKRERKKSYNQSHIHIPSFQGPDSSSNTSSCDSSTPSSPALLITSHTPPSASRSQQFIYPEPDLGSDVFIEARPIHEYISEEVHQSQDGGRTVSMSGTSNSGSTDSERTLTGQIDSQDSQISESEFLDRHWPRQNSLSLREWDIPFEELHIEKPPLGSGRFGTVHRGHWHGDVAVKLLHMDCLDDDKTIEAFKAEVATFRKTRHENLVLFMGACMKPPAIVTSMCRGMTLHTYIHLRKDKFNMNKSILIAQQISQGMGYLHARGIIHKDMKTKNIFLENGKVVITDFGLFNVTKLCHKDRKGAWLSIPPGWLCYLSPEIMRSLHAGQDVDLPFTMTSDTYAFGTVWYELLCGEWPFKGNPPESIIWQVGKGMKQSLANLQASRDVKDILMTCWAYKPQERPDFSSLLKILEKLPKKRLARSPSHPVHLSRSAESVF